MAKSADYCNRWDVTGKTFATFFSPSVDLLLSLRKLGSQSLDEFRDMVTKKPRPALQLRFWPMSGESVPEEAEFQPLFGL